MYSWASKQLNASALTFQK